MFPTFISIMKWASCCRDCISMASICIVVIITSPCWMPYSLYTFCRRRRFWFFDASQPRQRSPAYTNNTALPVEPGQQLENVAERLERVAQTRRFTCNICLNDKHHQIVFNPCGHSSCAECAVQLSTCHICRCQIDNKIRLFN